jgi:pectinesterase
LQITHNESGLDEKLSEAENNKLIINVNQSGATKFKTITEALSGVPTPNTRRVVISIVPGVYKYKKFI